MVGFEEVEYRYTDTVLFRFRGLCEFRRRQLGEEHLDTLSQTIARQPPAGPAAPAYLMADEAAADRRFASHLSGRAKPHGPR